jgi:hypothetical protein
MCTRRAIGLLAQVFSVIVLIAPARGVLAQTAEPTAPLRFHVTYNPAVCGSFTGRVYVMLTTSKMGEPRLGPSWFNPDPFFAIDVVDWKPNTPLVFDDNAIGMKDSLGDLVDREWSVQAVMRVNKDSPSIGRGAGTASSPVLRKQLSGANGGDIDLRIDTIVEPKPFKETDRIKLVEIPSPSLTEFHQRPMSLRAAIVLPKDYDQNPSMKYPAYYWIGGFGSDHTSAGYMTRQWDETGYSDRIARIVLDPSCFGGHHAFADSDNNGPVGRALVSEFIPYLEQTYRLVSSPSARFVSGHSSGGWSSLWLQVAYPEFFGGCWSIAPDPVDFRDFQRINLYAPKSNMYVDEQGQERPLARSDSDQVMILYEDFARMEVPYGEGGQLRSFEWVFSRRGADGLPEPLYDRQTGEVNPAVADSWKRYDIRLILESNWPSLGSKLAGKIHVFMGDKDTFFLEGATKLLQESQSKLGSDAVIEIVPNRNHMSIASAALRKRIDQELLAVFDEDHPEYRSPAP